VTIISVVLYGRAIVILGASVSAAFGALVPLLSAVIAIPLLGEWPTPIGPGLSSSPLGCSGPPAKHGNRRA